ncbi:hypothetical protein EDD85DRAFT_972904 [Armillaria nabsnona]|nr:hypothetical protein EDD85DRAFT_972904 [Armillaria nabsnona]
MERGLPRESTGSICGDANEIAVNWYRENSDCMACSLSSDQSQHGGVKYFAGHFEKYMRVFRYRAKAERRHTSVVGDGPVKWHHGSGGLVTRATKSWQGANGRNQTQAPRTHSVVAHYFEEQRGSRNGRVYGTELTKRKRGVKHAAIQEKRRH